MVVYRISKVLDNEGNERIKFRDTLVYIYVIRTGCSAILPYIERTGKAISTSIVKEITMITDDFVEFKTDNSKYLLFREYEDEVEMLFDVNDVRVFYN